MLLKSTMNFLTPDPCGILELLPKISLKTVTLRIVGIDAISKTVEGVIRRTIFILQPLLAKRR